MIAEVTAAAGARGLFQAAVDRFGEAVGPSSATPPENLNTVLAHFELPDALAQRLTPPFGELGFKLEAAQSAEPLPEPATYTRVSNGSHVLAFIHLPPQLFPPTQLSVLALNGFGHSFMAGTRLHVFSQDRDAVPEMIDTGMKSWRRYGVDATFHPWQRVGELEQVADKVGFVRRVFSIPANGGPQAGGAAATKLTPPQYRALSDALVSAFPTYIKLSRAIREQLDRALPNISQEAALDDVVFLLIETATAEGWLKELVTGARAANPGSAELLAAAQQIPPELGGEPA